MNQMQRGFTLTELLVTITMAAIFLSLAVPGYYSFIQNNKVTAVVNTLSGGLNYARMEAVKRGIKVSVCSASNASLNNCGSATQWTQGWVIFLDADNNDQVDNSANLIRVNEALPSGTVVTASSNIISFDASGFVTSGAFSLTIMATGCTGNNARILTVSSSGRLSIAKTVCT